ncbi:hypothetical protein AK812_SmicGene133 [Symbiodinium microadriaticum]|uniref:Uncharacterized protein n=1 Tax=Symbiodinium microadriaticum TaxID=2951 RepID=A0A1Q9F7J8_SYMMI|nr:hypothetical protein AK812_SmicGene133 [Symbiodinium microadriaticum]
MGRSLEVEADRFSHDLIQATPIPEGYLNGVPAVPAVNLQADVATIVRVPKRQIMKTSSPKRLVKLLSLASATNCATAKEKRDSANQILGFAKGTPDKINSRSNKRWARSGGVLDLRSNELSNREDEDAEIYFTDLGRPTPELLPVAAADAATEAEVADAGCFEIQRRCSGTRDCRQMPYQPFTYRVIQAVSSTLQAEKKVRYTLPGGWLYLPGEYK